MPPLINIKVHADFVAAGADVITTNNFVCVRHHLAEAGLEGELTTITQAAAGCAARAAAAASCGRRRVAVAGALPPLQTCYLPPAMPAGEMLAQYSEIAGALAPSVDVLLAETLCTAAEACAAATAAAAHGQPVWVGLTIDDDASGTLRGGGSAAAAVLALRALRLPRLEAVLLNCSAPQAITAALPGVRAAAGHLAVGGYGNAFEDTTSAWLAGTATNAEWRASERGIGCSCCEDLRIDAADYRPQPNGPGIITEHAYARQVGGWAAGGATLLGGCCGVTPAHIAELARQHGGGSHGSGAL